MLAIAALLATALGAADPADPAPAAAAATPPTPATPTPPAPAPVDAGTLRRAADAPTPLPPSTRLWAAALSGASGGAGGALFPLAVFGGALAGVSALELVRPALPAPPPPNDFSRNEGYAECVGVPTILCVVGGLEGCGFVVGLGAAYGLGALGALPGGTEVAGKAGLGALVGACAGCGAGWCGTCGYMSATSTTSGTTTTFGNVPVPYGAVFVTATSAIGAGIGATTATLVATGDDASMAY